MAKKLFRSGNDKMIGGVAGGLSEYFDIDPVILRILFVLLLFAYGSSFFFYILMWIIVPINPKHRFPMSQKEKMEEASDIDDIHDRKKRRGQNKSVFGGIIITIGVIWLFNNMFPQFDLSWIVPLCIIALGAYILYKNPSYNNKTKVSHE